MKKATPLKSRPTNDTKHNTKDLAINRWVEILTRLGVDGALLDGKSHAYPELGCTTDGFRFIDKTGDGYCSLGHGEYGDGFGFLSKLHGWDFKKAAHEIDSVMGWSGEAYKPPTQKERAKLQATHDEEARKREETLAEQHRSAAKQSLVIWEGATIADNTHPYLIAKGVSSYGLKVWDGKLLVPVLVNGDISSLQYINANGDKLFHRGGNVLGGYYLIKGDKRGSIERVTICEGFATGASVREATGQYVAVAFNANNLVKVAIAIHAKSPKTKITVAADNDQKTSVNVGLDAAITAAQAVTGLVALPAGKQGYSVDFNDLHATQGVDVVAAGIANAVDPDMLRNDEVDSSGAAGLKVGKLSNNHKESKASKNESTDPLLAAVQRLAGLSALEYDKVRTSEAESLGVRATTLDAEIKAARKAANSESSIFPDVEPWDDAVNGEDLLNDMVSIFKRYAILPDHAPEVAALWILNTYVHDAAYNSPMIMITSPEKRCGKTTTLNLFQALVRKPLPAGNISPAAIYRAIEKWRPSLLIDEADTFLKNNEEVAGVINSGHTKPSAFVIRCDGENNEPKQFSTWCPKVIAGIGNQRDTLEDRSIIFPLRRKLPHEQVERLRLDRGGFDDLKRKCARWAADNFTKCKNSDPEPIQDLEDRANDNWSPLLAIADLCGWSERARISAVLIRGEVEQSESVDTILLQDIQSLFKEQQAERLSSQRICDLLAALDDRPWSDWNKGRPITTNRLAGRLRSFGIHSKTMRLPNGERLKGYELSSFSDAFSRYLASIGDLVTSEQYQQKLAIQGVTSSSSVTDEKAEKAIYSNVCHDDTLQNTNADKCERKGNESGTEGRVIGMSL